MHALVVSSDPIWKLVGVFLFFWGGGGGGGGGGGKGVEGRGI